VRRLLDENYKRALAIVRENRQKMVRLAQKLIEVETLDRETFEKLMNEPGNGETSSEEVRSSTAVYEDASLKTTD
jgi:ATP-dependent Zn protease